MNLQKPSGQGKKVQQPSAYTREGAKDSPTDHSKEDEH